ncbi:Uma2 family endonuclease [Nocardioides sp. AE5]|uniref:Uma2 family endonuclease n=1 Tax=Nocardioides sp. AE5 TaxID=2962573 RepID=UPI00288106B7|nr:Uma2 family endonuclease [Nocardioides sp. AE5]MDT0201281.1 Uma2 family endonuclease [Nocardioides sp. AE5]
MSTDALQRTPMPLADYLALPEGIRAEWVDGIAIVTPTPTAPHQRISFRLANAIDEGCPGLFMVEAVGWRTSATRYRIPDIIATTEPFDGSWATTTPVIAVEILSPGTRTEDTVRKSHEYASAGVAHYWIVDRERHILTALVNSGDGWEILLELTAEQPDGSIGVGDHGTVEIRLDRLFAT